MDRPASYTPESRDVPLGDAVQLLGKFDPDHLSKSVTRSHQEHTTLAGTIIDERVLRGIGREVFKNAFDRPERCRRIRICIRHIAKYSQRKIVEWSTETPRSPIICSRSR